MFCFKLSNYTRSEMKQMCHVIILMLIFMSGYLYAEGPDSSKAHNTKIKERGSKEPFPVILYISKENGTIDPVNVNVRIDGKDSVVNRDFSNRGKMQVDSTKKDSIIRHYIPPYNDVKFEFTLSEGVHQIIVTSSNGDAGLDV